MENIVGMEYKTTDNNITGKTNLETETKKEKHYEEVMTHFYIELLKLSNWINTQTTSYKQKYFHRYRIPEIEKILEYATQIQEVANEVRRQLNHISKTKSIDLEEKPILKSVIKYIKQ